MLNEDIVKTAWKALREENHQLRQALSAARYWVERSSAYTDAKQTLLNINQLLGDKGE